MTILQAIVLGIIQGLTEFLPVSSSSHLIITQHLFRLQGPILLLFDVTVHVGTLLAIFIYFGREYFEKTKQTVPGTADASLRGSGSNKAEAISGIASSALRPPRNDGRNVPGTVNISLRLIWLIVVATIPTGLIGLLMYRWMQHTFTGLTLTAVTLLINSGILWSTKMVPKISPHPLNGIRAFWIGIAQGISILPGISRSGATITTALWLKIDAEEAARFSFFIAIPAILAAMILVIPDVIEHFSHGEWPVLAAGFLSAFVSGYLAIGILFKVLLRGKFHHFAWYTLALAAVSFAYSFIQ